MQPLWRGCRIHARRGTAVTAVLRTAFCRESRALLSRGLGFSLFFLFFSNFYSRASSGHVKPWSEGSPLPPPPGTCLYILCAEGSAFPAVVDFHRTLLTHALALSASQFLPKKKSLRVRIRTRGGLEPAKSTLDGTRLTHQTT